jgi:H+/gluconate symporter-like permease
MDEVTISIIGIVIGLGLVTYLIMKGVNIFVIALFCSSIVALSGGINLYTALKTHYMDGFVGFMKANYLIFLGGTLLGKIMETTNGAKAIAQLLIKLFGKDKAIVSVPLACGILGYGGVSAFVISFCVFPIALQIFKEADLPRRFIPAALTFGCSTFAMIAPGAPQIHNAIPVNALNKILEGTGESIGLMSGMVVGFVSCGAMLLIGCLWLFHIVKSAKKEGEHFVAKPMDVFKTEGENLPNGYLALIPLIVTILIINIKIDNQPIVQLETGLFLGSLLAWILMNKYQDNGKLLDNLGDTCKNSMIAIANTCAVVGFGTVVQHARAFPEILNAVLNIPGPPLVGVAVAMNVIAGICGSASGGLAIATPLIAPAYLARGISAAIMHRTLAIASSALDSLPHNGYIVTVTNGICNETHKDAYGAVFKLTVITPLIGTAIAVVLFTLFPTLP